MLDLVWKDFVAARRWLWLVFLLGTVQIGVMSFRPLSYVAAVLIFSALLAIGSTWIEEYEQTELLWNSVPVSRGEFVAARYLTALIGIAVGLSFSWVLAQLVTRTASSVADGPAALLSLESHLVLFGLLLFAAAIYLPLYLRYGAGRGLLYFSGIALALVIAVSLTVQTILTAKGYPNPTSNPETLRTLMAQTGEWLEPRFALLLSTFVAASAAAMFGSLTLSRWFYEVRDL
jgi:ABC-type transport system involved in multi-copper enzyme maturation permease subunit